MAVPRVALARLGLNESALPAPVRLDDRFGGPPLTVLVTGVYRAADPDSAYWRLDPLGGREIQVTAFTTYGPLMVDDTAFTTGGLPQNYRGTLLTPDLGTIRTGGGRAVRTAAKPAAVSLERTASLQAGTELPEVLAQLDSGLLVARSTLLLGALQLAVLSAAALLLVSHIMTARQEPERVLLTARGAPAAGWARSAPANRCCSPCRRPSWHPSSRHPCCGCSAPSGRSAGSGSTYPAPGWSGRWRPAAPWPASC